jgi:hypothetical protein
VGAVCTGRFNVGDGQFDSEANRKRMTRGPHRATRGQSSPNSEGDAPLRMMTSSLPVVDQCDCRNVGGTLKRQIDWPDAVILDRITQTGSGKCRAGNRFAGNLA